MPGITLVGLGPGKADEITVEAHSILSTASEVWVISPEHLALHALPSTTNVRLLGGVENHFADDLSALQALVAAAIQLGGQPNGAIVALPGHPIFGNPLGAAIWDRTHELGVACRVVMAASAVDAILAASPTSTPTPMSICTAADLAEAHIPPFPPDAPALIIALHGPQAAEVVRIVLERVYPAQHEVTLYALPDGAQPTRLRLADLGKLGDLAFGACLYVPPLPSGSSLEALQEVIAHLRAPEGCPWDRKQTHASLRPHLLEEAYEAMQAMDSEDAPALREELGDLLLQIMLNAQIASEAGDFTLNDVTRGIHDKLIRRHPHVFGDLQLTDVDGVLSNWEKLKEGERAQNGDSSGLMDGVPSALPALSQAQEYQDRAARVGFDWSNIAGVLAKLREEVDEVRAAKDDGELEAELGDLLFSLVNLARWKSVDAESALRAANQRFRRRFSHIEAAAREEGRRLSDLSLQEMDQLWNQAKAGE